MEENTIQERKHQKENVPQIKRQQIPNHQLLRISHKTSPPLNNSHKTNLFLKSNHNMCPYLNNSHKKNPPWNSSHKARPPQKNNYRMYQNPILFRHSPAVMIHFQIMPQLSNFFHERPQLYTKEAKIQFKTIIIQVLIQFYCLFIFSFQSMQRKTGYFRTYQVFELSANVPKFIFSNIMLFYVSYFLPNRCGEDSTTALRLVYTFSLYSKFPILINIIFFCSTNQTLN